MDVVVTPSPDGKDWDLADLLGRDMGRVAATPGGGFAIRPAGRACETMAGIETGIFVSVDAALTAIETRTRGPCRRGPESRG